MDSKPILLAGAALLAFFLLKPNSADAHTYEGLDISYLDSYGADDLARLQRLLNDLGTRGLSDLQIKMMLSQALQETGIFTDGNANYNAVDNLHNYAGISSSGHLKAYASISDFVDDWLRVLDREPNRPIDASNIADFNNRLKANGYYTDSATTYGNNLKYYFNLLSQA